MKTKLFKISLFIAFFAILALNANAQKSNGTLQIISVAAPDSLSFTVAPEKEIKEVSVYLVSGEQSIKGDVFFSGLTNMSMENGEMVFTYTEDTTFNAKNFKIPAGFKAKKIKFVVDGKIMHYNLLRSAWEK